MGAEGPRRAANGPPSPLRQTPGLPSRPPETRSGPRPTTTPGSPPPPPPPRPGRRLHWEGGHVGRRRPWSAGRDGKWKGGGRGEVKETKNKSRPLSCLPEGAGAGPPTRPGQGGGRRGGSGKSGLRDSSAGEIREPRVRRRVPVEAGVNLFPQRPPSAFSSEGDPPSFRVPRELSCFSSPPASADTWERRTVSEKLLRPHLRSSCVPKLLKHFFGLEGEEVLTDAMTNLGSKPITRAAWAHSTLSESRSRSLYPDSTPASVYPLCLSHMNICR
ncbi:uncharacterized protein ACOB8E_013300 [Sarcophilus harrisii]